MSISNILLSNFCESSVFISEKEIFFSIIQVSKPLPSNVEERCKVALSQIVKVSFLAVLAVQRFICP